MSLTGPRWDREPPKRVPWASSNRRDRLPPNWPVIRRRIWVRDRGLCQMPVDTGGLCGAPARDVDHRIRGDNHADANLWCLCGPCHDEKTQAEAQAARVFTNRPTETHPGLL